MSAQSGRNYRPGLREQEREIWFDRGLREAARLTPGARDGRVLLMNRSGNVAPRHSAARAA